MLNCPRQYLENKSQFRAWRNRNNCNFSNMEYKLSKYIWNRQLTGFSAAFLLFILLLLQYSCQWHVSRCGVFDILSCRWCLCTTRFKHSTMKIKCVRSCSNFWNHFKCFVLNQSLRNGAKNKMRSRSRIQKVLMFTFQRNMCKIHQTLHFISLKKTKKTNTNS